MSGIDPGTTVEVTAETSNGSRGTVVSWDDTRQQYLVDLGDEEQRYFGGDELDEVMD